MRVTRYLRLTAILALAWSVGGTGVGAAKKKDEDKVPYEEFESATYFVPDAPMSDVVEVEIDPKQKEFMFGEQPQFTVTLRNISKKPISLAGHLEGGVIFSPQMRMGYYRGDKTEFNEILEFEVPAGHELLMPGATLKTDFPSSKQLALTKRTYRNTPDVLLPGQYKAYLNFWVLSKGENTRAISRAVEFTVKSDGSRDVEIARQIQEGTSLPEGFEFVLEDGANKTVRLIGVNRSNKSVYLGNDWRWWRRYPGKAATTDVELPKLRQRVEIRPNSRRLLAQEAVAGASFKGEYQIRFQYFNQQGKKVAESKIYKTRL